MDNKQAALALGQKPVGQLLWQYALPAIVAMTASSLYNIIDRAMIGQVVGPEAIAGLGITFPFMNLSAAFGAAVGVGSSTCISVKLGQKDYDTAQHLLGNTVTLNLVIGFVFMVVCLLFLDPILLFFGASEVTLPYAREFMTVILLGNMVTHMYFGMNAVLRAAGKPRHAMWATLFTVACNIVLVVAFVWWFRWGIRGAALATVTSQSLAMCWLRRRYGRGCLFDSELDGYGVLHVRDGHDPGYATHCWLQLRCREIRPYVPLSVDYHCLRHCHPVSGVGTVDGIPASDCPNLYYRRNAARSFGAGTCDRYACVLRRRLSGGDYQFLPVHRQGEGLNLPLAVATTFPVATDGVYIPVALGS